MKRVLLIFSLCFLCFVSISAQSGSKANELRESQIRSYQMQIERLQTSKGNDQAIAKLGKRIEVLKNRIKNSNLSKHGKQKNRIKNSNL